MINGFIVSILSFLLTLTGLGLMVDPTFYRKITAKMNLLALRGLSLFRLVFGLFLAIQVAPSLAIPAIVQGIGTVAVTIGAIGLCCSSETLDKVKTTIVDGDEKYLHALGSLAFTMGLACTLAIIG